MQNVESKKVVNCGHPQARGTRRREFMLFLDSAFCILHSAYAYSWIQDPQTPETPKTPKTP